MGYDFYDRHCFKIDTSKLHAYKMHIWHQNFGKAEEPKGQLCMFLFYYIPFTYNPERIKPN